MNAQRLQPFTKGFHSLDVISQTTIASLTSILIFGTSAVADAGYKPPRHQRPPRNTPTITGTRGGCNETSNASLALLAPSSHVGQTLASHPTFAWFIPATTPLPLHFSLYEYHSDEELSLIYSVPLTSTTGITTLTLPQDAPALTLGQSYLWQVALMCDRADPTNSQIASAEIEVIKLPLVLSEALLQMEDRPAQAQFYAEIGLWYDALREGIAIVQQSQQKDVLSSLLADLASLEAELPQTTTFEQ